MATIVGVRIKNSGKLFYFSPANVWPKRGDKVIVETVRGVVMGEVVLDLKKIDDDMITIPLKPVIRIATQEDIMHQKELDSFAVQAFRECKAKIEEHNLDMKLVRVEPMFDDSKIMFYFTANQRIDFRDLVKDLASMYKRRIELRQIGVRDEAKIIGTLGSCGRKVCCAGFLNTFQPVSIKMAKEQSLSLNPTKISGACGRLMCCLKYEQDYYELMHKLMPKVNKEVDTPDGKGIVSEVNVLMETIKVKIQKDDDTEIKTYMLEQINNPEAYAVDKEEKQITEFEQFIIDEKAKQKEQKSSKPKEKNINNTNNNQEQKTSKRPRRVKYNKNTSDATNQKTEKSQQNGKQASNNLNSMKSKIGNTFAELKKRQKFERKPNIITEEKKKKVQSSWQKAVEKAIENSQK
mgnify:CR=1 FL=1